MNVWRTWTFAIRPWFRSVLPAVAACALVLFFIIGNHRQSRLAQEALARATAAEQAAARARADAEQARAQTQPPKDAAVRRTLRHDAKAAERVNQLYEEIMSLSNIQQRIQSDLSNLRAKSAPETTP
jgi:chemotaxis protein histidine kinase CheA